MLTLAQATVQCTLDGLNQLLQPQAFQECLNHYMNPQPLPRAFRTRPLGGNDGPCTVQVAQRAEDLQRATAFYADLLGVPPTATYDPPAWSSSTSAAPG